jgi:hypothetical protein
MDNLEENHIARKTERSEYKGLRRRWSNAAVSPYLALRHALDSLADDLWHLYSRPTVIEGTQESLMFSK